MIVKKTTKEICKVLTNDRWELDKPKTKYSSAHIKEGFENYEDRVWFSQESYNKLERRLSEVLVEFASYKANIKKAIAKLRENQLEGRYYRNYFQALDDVEEMIGGK